MRYHFAINRFILRII